MKNNINKYEIVSGYTFNGQYIEGSTSYSDLSLLISDYKKKLNIEGLKIIRVCLTCEYMNSLPYTIREDIRREEEKKLFEELKKYHLSV